MIGMLIVGLPFIGVCAWLYFRFSPRKIEERIPFEALAILLLGVGIYLVTKYCYRSMVGTNDSAWWPVLAFIYNLGFIPLYFITAAAIRKLVYRSTEQGGVDNPSNAQE